MDFAPDDKKYTYYGAIDIGSNAVRLLIKRLDDKQTGRFSKVVTMRVPLRLGQEVFTYGRISSRKGSDLRKLIASYANVLDIYKVKPQNFRGCATAAMREASNGQALLKRISAATGVPLDIIDGTEEAQIVCGASLNANDVRNLVYVDVGGGSTEVSLIVNGYMVCTQSYPIGTVRMINGAVSEADWQRLLADMHSISAAAGEVTIVGAGGNINKLFGLAQGRHSTENGMTVHELQALYSELDSLSMQERIERFRLKPDRSDVIVPAAQIYLAIAEALAAENIEVPTMGLSDGIVEDLFRRQQSKRKKR